MVRAALLLLTMVSACSAAAARKDPGPSIEIPEDASADAAAPSHCGAFVQKTSAASCAVEAGVADDAGDGEPTGFGATSSAREADDDLCKYKVGWSVPAIARGRDLTFTITVRARDGAAMVRGAAPRAEAFLEEARIADVTGATSRETAPGTYAIGPIRFDTPGRWTVRWHLFATCTLAAPESPRSQVAFFVDVP
jgi:hypothetical protein